jgi:putative heme iron utilization protein
MNEKTKENMASYQDIIKLAADKKTKQLTTRLSAHDMKTVERIAKHYNVSKCKVIRVAVRSLAKKLSIRAGVLDD